MQFTKVALVTAGSAGLSAAIVRVLASEAEMYVVIDYSNNAGRAVQLINVLTDLSKNHPKHTSGDTRFLAIRADVGQHCEVQRLIEPMTFPMGRLDVVVSNAGWARCKGSYCGHLVEPTGQPSVSPRLALGRSSVTCRGHVPVVYSSPRPLRPHLLKDSFLFNLSCSTIVPL